MSHEKSQNLFLMVAEKEMGAGGGVEAESKILPGS